MWLWRVLGTIGHQGKTLFTFDCKDVNNDFYPIGENYELLFLA